VRRIQSLAPSSRRLSALRRNHSKKKHANTPATMRHITRTASTSVLLSTAKSSTTVITTTRRSSTADNSRPQRNTPYLRPVHKRCNVRNYAYNFSILLTTSLKSLSRTLLFQADIHLPLQRNNSYATCFTQTLPALRCMWTRFRKIRHISGFTQVGIECSYAHICIYVCVCVCTYTSVYIYISKNIYLKEN
jgi:hypothetical protein